VTIKTIKDVRYEHEMNYICKKHDLVIVNPHQKPILQNRFTGCDHGPFSRGQRTSMTLPLCPC